MRIITVIGLALSLCLGACVAELDTDTDELESLGGGKTLTDDAPDASVLESDPEANLWPVDCGDPYNYCPRDGEGGGGSGTGGGGSGGGGGGSGGGSSGGGGWLCTAPGYRWMARYGMCVYVGMPCNGLCDVATEGVCVINVNYICECSGGTGC